MLRPRSALATAAVLAVLLGGCASDPATDLRDAVAETIEAANDGDAGDLRGSLANLRAEIDRQVRAAELDSDEATRLLAIVQQLEADAALLEQEEEPSPSPSSESPSPSPSPEPEPTEEPEETEEPEPEPTEEPEPEPEPTEEPEPEPTELLPSPAVTEQPSPSASPAQAVRPVAGSPSPSGA